MICIFIYEFVMILFMSKIYFIVIQYMNIPDYNV